MKTFKQQFCANCLEQIESNNIINPVLSKVLNSWKKDKYFPLRFNDKMTYNKNHCDLCGCSEIEKYEYLFSDCKVNNKAKKYC